MRSRAVWISKKIIAVLLVIASIVSVIMAILPKALSKASYDTLNSNRALGSPLLNTENFNTEDWNPWETICWGVFLSNFCKPLVDNYETAFDETSVFGSKGAGFRALWGGSGSDAANKDVIRALTKYAISMQGSITEPIYVSYDGINYRPAHFQDLFFYPKDECPSGDACSTVGELSLESNEDKRDHVHTHYTYMETESVYMGPLAGALNLAHIFWKPKKDSYRLVNFKLEGGEDYYSRMLVPSSYSLPIFAVQREENEYIKILNYQHWWDVQVASQILNTYIDDDSFIEAFQNKWETNSPLKLDFFGNIVTNGISESSNSTAVVIIPSASNPNLTKTKSINILNSAILNSYVSPVSESQLLMGFGQESLNEGFKKWLSGFTGTNYLAGTPALASTQFKDKTGIFYYDLDSIIVENLFSRNYGNYGDSLSTLFRLDINDESINTVYPIKFEVTANNSLSKRAFADNLSGSDVKTDALGIITTTAYASAMLPNILFSTIYEQEKVNMLTEIIQPNGDKLKLFGSEGLAVQVIDETRSLAEEVKNPTNKGAEKLIFNFLYKASKSDGQYGVTQHELDKLKNECATTAQFKDFVNSDNIKNAFNFYYNKYSENSYDINTDRLRVILAYPCSELMRQVSQVLGNNDGAEFTTYCTYIYMTYLDFYGVASAKDKDSEKYDTSNFNEKIYSDRSIIADIAKTMKEYDLDFGDQISLKDKVTNYGYLLLSPEGGREYRKQLTESSLADWMYEQYNKTVYGGASEFSGTSSKAKSGFLAIETLADNWFTSAFVDNYADIAIWLIMGSLVAILIIGLFKGKKFSWFLMSIILMVNIILLVPASGDIVPYVASNITQNMFRPKMTYWAISQGITNQQVQQDALKLEEAKKLSSTEAKQLSNLINNLGSLQTDTSLSIKQDISQKVTQRLGAGVYQDIMSYQSARWILPMIMQQFSADDKSAKYIYKPLANVWEDLSNCYWYFDRMNAINVNKSCPTITSGQGTDVVVSKFSEGENGTVVDIDDPSGLSVGKIKNKFGSFIEQSQKYSAKDNLEIDFRNASYIKKDEHNSKITYSDRDSSSLVHRVCYLLVNSSGENIVSPGNTKDLNDIFGSRGEKYVDADSWENLLDYAAYVKISFEEAEKSIEDSADQYDRTDRNTITDEMPYLWSTESPMYYFFAVVKDSFPNNCSLGILANRLQGEVEQDENGKDLRYSFMHCTEEVGNESKATGYVRDVLDLEEMFTNMIPYMYQMSIMANGFDGVSGIFGDAKISDKLTYYEGELQSWLFRCNWATKIMENPSFSERTTVKDKDGNVYDIYNPLMPQWYPDERPMVFSEGQMYEMGLAEADLNLVELKCIEVNKQVARQWTLLINYISTPGITLEILMRQMATDATMIFCDEFSSSGILDTTYTIYPQSLDLRYLSFDSIMKMLMMNISKDTSYIYGDTMLTVIQSSDIFTAALLLIAAWLCAFLVPLFRAILMAVIFYLGIWALIRGLFYTNKVKGNMACGQLVSTLLFMVYTLIYYGAFAIMTATVSADEVLTVTSVKAEAGSPAWVLLFVILLSGVYMVVMFKHVKFCFENRADMGFEKFSALASGIAATVKDKASNLKSDVKNMFSREDSESNSYSTSSTQSLKGTGSMRNSPAQSNVYSSSASSSTSSSYSSDSSYAESGGGFEDTETTVEVNRDDTRQSLDDRAGDYNANFSFENSEAEIDNLESTDAEEINATIDTGEEIDDKS